ncbi:hypothetical protein ABWV16_25380, partial [Bacillus velezensis]|uniref:hypothetical protein n=1 Tax=Bacillus velezensis TaxID=492670 RepID=UPI0033993B54
QPCTCCTFWILTAIKSFENRSRPYKDSRRSRSYIVNDGIVQYANRYHSKVYAVTMIIDFEPDALKPKYS